MATKLSPLARGAVPLRLRRLYYRVSGDAARYRDGAALPTLYQHGNERPSVTTQGAQGAGGPRAANFLSNSGFGQPDNVGAPPTTAWALTFHYAAVPCLIDPPAIPVDTARQQNGEVRHLTVAPQAQ